jgi:hypothetical protein
MCRWGFDASINWQLWLAQDLVRDYHLPWQKPLTNLRPDGWLNLFPLLVKIGTRLLHQNYGENPLGWPTGQSRSSRPR